MFSLLTRVTDLVKVDVISGGHLTAVKHTLLTSIFSVALALYHNSVHFQKRQNDTTTVP